MQTDRSVPFGGGAGAVAVQVDGANGTGFDGFTLTRTACDLIIDLAIAHEANARVVDAVARELGTDQGERCRSASPATATPPRPRCRYSSTT